MYATTNAAGRWRENWYDGLDTSPNQGYTEAVPGGMCFNADATAGFSIVEWVDGDGSDEGVYRLPPIP